MNSLANSVEPELYQIKELVVLMPIGTPKGISDHICVLDQRSSLGIDEERNIHKVSQFAPAMTVGAKVQRQLLKAGFFGGLIHDDDPTLGIASSVHSPEEVIETATQLLEAILHHIFILHRRLFNDDTKECRFPFETFRSSQRIA